MAQDERLERAKKRVKILREFYSSLAAYVVVMIVLFIVDYSDRGNWWVYWPAMGWGIALVLHAFRVFGPGAGSGWEKRKIQQYMEEDGEEE
ncbi:2TM domain-containing protein [Candidatus Bipolaricaulota bacterium]